MRTIINEVILSLRSYADDNRIEFAKRSYPTSMDVIGVTNPNSKIVLKALKDHTKGYTEAKKIKLAHQLYATNIFECQHIALEFLGKDKRALNALTLTDINALNQNMDNWVSVDCYAGYIYGYAWREGIVSTSALKTLLQSNDFWQRRIAVVSTVALNQKARGGKGDAPKTLEICELVIDDHHDMIIKALSWALRELAKIEPAPVQQFIGQHRNRLHPRVLERSPKN